MLLNLNIWFSLTRWFFYLLQLLYFKFWLTWNIDCFNILIKIIACLRLLDIICRRFFKSLPLSNIFTFRQDNLFDELYLLDIIVELLSVFFPDLIHSFLCYLFESLLNVFCGTRFWFNNILAIKRLERVILTWIASWDLSLFLSLFNFVSSCGYFT